MQQEALVKPSHGFPDYVIIIIVLKVNTGALMVNIVPKTLSYFFQGNKLVFKYVFCHLAKYYAIYIKHFIFT